MKEWECVKCGHVVLADERPEPIRWTDGHVCYFREVRDDKFTTDLEDIEIINRERNGS